MIWPSGWPGPPGWEYGVPLGYVQDLVSHWRHHYDWRAWEAKLNHYPQFTTTIDGQTIHFAHLRSPEPDALALILTHAWPNTFLEYLDLADPSPPGPGRPRPCPRGPCQPALLLPSRRPRRAGGPHPRRARPPALPGGFAERAVHDKLQATQPQTIAHALADSPAGQLAWSGQLFGHALSNDHILTT
jgi:hypothetical protein